MISDVKTIKKVHSWPTLAVGASTHVDDKHTHHLTYRHIPQVMTIINDVSITGNYKPGWFHDDPTTLRSLLLDLFLTIS